MATTAIEINTDAVAGECYQRRVQELTDVIASHSLRFRRIALVIWATRLTRRMQFRMLCCQP